MAAGLQNVQFWEASVPPGLGPTSAQIGGSARDYPAGFASLAARLWPSAIGPTRIFQPVAQIDPDENDLHTGVKRSRVRRYRPTQQPKADVGSPHLPPRLDGQSLCNRLIYASASSG